jgi:hypothetical protein
MYQTTEPASHGKKKQAIEPGHQAGPCRKQVLTAFPQVRLVLAASAADQSNSLSLGPVTVEQRPGGLGKPGQA